MGKWNPCKRRDFIKKLINEIEHGIAKKITIEEWENL